MKSHWKETTALGRTLSLIRLLAAIGVVALAALQLLGIWDNAIDLAIPLLGIVLLIQSVQEWNRQRGAAVCSLFAALFVFGTTVAGRLM